MEYLIDRHGTNAAIRAGYSVKGAHVQASRLLNSAKIRKRVHELQAEQARRLCIDADWVVLRFIEVAMRCMQAEPVIEWCRDSREYVQKGIYQFDSRGANRALELLGKHFGFFVEKTEPGAAFADAIIAAYKKDRGGESIASDDCDVEA